MNPLSSIAIFGAGGQGREVLQLLRHINQQELQWKCIGWFDDGIEKGTIIDGLPVLGGLKEINAWEQPLSIAMAVAWPSTKRKIVQLISNPLITFPTLIHPTVSIDTDEVNIGQGSIITQGCLFTINIELGQFVLLNLGCVLTHDVKVGDYCSVMPSVNLSGAVVLEEGAYIGTGVQVIQLLTIGKDSIIGAGSVVINDIPANSTAVGVPAKVL